MATECANYSTTCDHCGYKLKSSDCFPIVLGDLSAIPPSEEDYVYHCICYQCGKEWVE